MQPNDIDSSDSIRKSSVAKSKEIKSLDKDTLNDNICTPN